MLPAGAGVQINGPSGGHDGENARSAAERLPGHSSQARNPSSCAGSPWLAVAKSGPVGLPAPLGSGWEGSEGPCLGPPPPPPPLPAPAVAGNAWAVGSANGQPSGSSAGCTPSRHSMTAGCNQVCCPALAALPPVCRAAPGNASRVQAAGFVARRHAAASRHQGGHHAYAEMRMPGSLGASGSMNATDRPRLAVPALPPAAAPIAQISTTLPALPPLSHATLQSQHAVCCSPIGPIGRTAVRLACSPGLGSQAGQALLRGAGATT